MKRSVLSLLCVLLCLVLIVSAFLSAEYFNTEEIRPGMENNFQQVVHGIGLGATAKPTWCYINFDPRIDPRCSCIEWPIPGGYCYCPDHAGTVSSMAGNMKMGVSIEIVKSPSAVLPQLNKKL